MFVGDWEYKHQNLFPFLCGTAGHREYHVQFFGSVAERAWIHEKRIVIYQGKKQFDELQAETLRRATNPVEKSKVSTNVSSGCDLIPRLRFKCGHITPVGCSYETLPSLNFHFINWCHILCCCEVRQHNDRQVGTNDLCFGLKLSGKEKKVCFLCN